MNFWSVYWVLWLVSFLVPELYWLLNNSYNTLSWNVWRFEDLSLSQPYDFPMWTATHWLAAITVWLLFLWLSVHLPFGLLR